MRKSSELLEIIGDRVVEFCSFDFNNRLCIMRLTPPNPTLLSRGWAAYQITKQIEIKMVCYWCDDNKIRFYFADNTNAERTFIEFDGYASTLASWKELDN